MELVMEGLFSLFSYIFSIKSRDEGEEKEKEKAGES
jgi:hypothetical protein